MNSGRGSETEFEAATIERFEGLGYEHIHGSNVERDKQQVVFRDRLRASIASLYPELPSTAVDEATRRFSRPEGANTLRRNRNFHLAITQGIEICVEWPSGREEYRHVYPIDWDEPDANEFLVVNQLEVRGPRNDRRPDIVIFVNGLPLAIFELKNPYHEDPTIDHAFNQIEHYKYDIPSIFEYNEVTVVSDGIETLQGMWSASKEWFTPWKSIDGEGVEPATTSTMRSLLEGLFPKSRFLSYIRNFVVFDRSEGGLTKKGAKYHQYFAVKKAVSKTLAAIEDDRKRIGVIWHTTGAGKSLSMAFLVGILRNERNLANPSFVIQVDRTDLDDQLYDQFVGAQDLVGEVKQATSIDDLRGKLRTEGGEVIFTTIEKFQLREDEAEHPTLSKRENIVVIADEAHRSQYGFLNGYARYLSTALPNAKRIGFTGTPVSFSDADTTEVFGEYIHTYDIEQAQRDGTTVPIYYSPRQVKLHLSEEDVEQALQELLREHGGSDYEGRKGRWAALANAAMASERLKTLSRDLLDHFHDRSASLEGKAMIVCMSREHCVRMYDALTSHSDCPEVRVVMTGNLSEDPPEWAEAGHITTKREREAIKEQMVDPSNSLKLVIVCDMWLTGTDIPCLHTLYVDKPMKGHNMIQAISRVNRVFRDKPHGLIVDYIGIGHELRQATKTYTEGGGRGEPAPDISDEAKDEFFDAREEVLAIVPEDIEYGAWRKLSHSELEDRYAEVFGILVSDEEMKEAFLEAEQRLSKAFILVKHLEECREYADEVIFFQRVRKQIKKAEPSPSPDEELDQAVKDLVDQSLESEGVVDIFDAAGLPKADISILDDEFLQTFKSQPERQDFRLRLLEKLLKDEIQSRQARNLAKARDFRERLEETLEKYHARIVDAAYVIREMIEIRKAISEDDARCEELGLDEDELAFYDAVADHVGNVYDDEFLADLIHQVVESVRNNLKVDWTEPHRENVRASIRAAVKRVLRHNGVGKDDFDKIVPFVMEQAEALYKDWPIAA